MSLSSKSTSLETRVQFPAGEIHNIFSPLAPLQLSFCPSFAEHAIVGPMWAWLVSGVLKVNPTFLHDMMSC